MPAVLLLAAGASRRMGAENKLLLPFRGQTLLEATLGQLEAAAVGEIFVVLGHEADRIRPVLAGRPCRIVDNPAYATGMTSSIQAGVTAAGEASGYMICLADMPLIDAATYRLVARTFEANRLPDAPLIVQPHFGGQRGHPVVFAAVYRDELLRLSDPEGARSVIGAHREHLLLVESPTPGVLLDADTPEAYQRLLKY